MRALLNTGSTIDEGRLAKGGSKFTDEYTKECGACWIAPEDFVALGSPEKVKVTSMDGRYTVAVYAKCTDRVRCGHVFMLRSIWSNIVIDPYTFSTGSPLYKGSPVTVEPTDDGVLSAEELTLREYVGGN